MNTVMVVDDDDNIRNLVVRLLRRDNYTIIGARDGLQALELYDVQRRNGLGLIITDIDMPEMSGLALIQRIRGYGDNIPIIAMSGEPDNKPKVIQAGGNEFIDKPFTLPTILEASARYMRR